MRMRWKRRRYMSRKKLDPVTRKERLELDAHECQFSKLFGIATLSGVECVKRKEAHHISYINAGKETTEDLITVCVRCHDFITGYIRALRYSRREYTTENIKIETVESKTQRKRRNVIQIRDNQL